MASVNFRLRSPNQEFTTIICRFYSRETGSIDISTSESVPTEFWQGQRVSAKYKKNHDRINRSLSQIECDLLDIWRNNRGASKEALKELITARLRGTLETDVQKKTLVSILTEFIDQYRTDKESNTVKMYLSLLKKVEEFNPDISPDHLDFNFYDAFKKFLYACPNPVYAGYSLHRTDDSGVFVLLTGDGGLPCGLFDDTVYKYIIHLKAVCAWAEKRGHEVHPSYKEWEVIRREYPVISLTLDELRRIEELRDLQAHLRISRDYFSIACRSGQRISDIKRISSLSTFNDTWKIFQKKGSRKKQKVVELPLKGFCAPIKEILTKYGGKLPEISEQHLNKHIKELCKLAGITQEIYIERWQGSRKIRIPGSKYEFIHLHTGKATFITILAGQGVPVKVISDLTGTTIKTIERHYLGRTDMRLMENYLSNIEGNQIRKAI